MKRRIAVILTFVYLFTATELNQLWKLPIFISHFIEHRQESPDITLFDFVALHYFSGDVRDADYARDEQLPFRDNSESIIGTISLLVPTAAGVSYESELLCQISFIPKTQEGKPCRSLATIWQPPRLA
ncbi:MAG: hypothetical protein U0289_01225 [Cyclobacteriaceae bacterium]|nr:hypothetical protein [Cytophagales bacterium]HNP75670.1 hypothetical protein [Cyclobacteriaceae bacterium]HQQ81785.1 hypothetical protein [Cyclobacteriaceae bacterium]